MRIGRGLTFGTGIAQFMLAWGREAFRHQTATFQYSHRETPMLRAAILFLVIALVAGLLGLMDVQFISAQIAWILFVVFLIFAVVSFIFGRRGSQSL